ncbi:MAG: hypothetical protein IJM76_10205 [Lachnospiraceae bacterium]|nr:hypothetical protein [Lachnospiraceae bacterium]
MDYSVIRDQYLASSLIGQIPDGFEESLPILFRRDGDYYVGWFYCEVDTEAELAGLAAVRTTDGKVVWIDTDRLAEKWQVVLTPCRQPEITDYDAYFEKKDDYLQVFSDCLKSGDNSEENILRMSALLFDIVGKELFERVFLPVALNIRKLEDSPEA